MGTGRLEAFSDAVIAIIITIMVLEFQVPHGDSPAELLPLLPVFVSYVLSFVYIGIYWNNHHHLLHACRTVTGAILWANLHLLFWLSLLPFATGWMGENNFTAVPTALYGVVLLMAAIAYWKGKLSPVLCIVAIGATLVLSWIAVAILATLALMWLIPDRRIESALPRNED